MERETERGVLERFRRVLVEDGKSGATVEKYMRDAAAFLCFLDGRCVDRGTVSEYKVFLSENYEVTSANSMIAAVNAFLKYLGRGDLCTKQFRVQKKAFCAENKELTRAEYYRLISTAGMQGKVRLSLIIQTICSSGIRVSELRSITVEAVKRGEAEVSLKGKTRCIFIVKELKKKLLCYAKEQKIESGMIFVTKSGKAVSRTNIWREMKSLCRDAKVDPQKVFPHNLRHLFARLFYEMEKDIAKLADILGHSSINTTRIYIVTTAKEHLKRMEKMRLIL